jgi:hypothetical protein
MKFLTKEYMIFTTPKQTKVKVSFLFDWQYELEGGFAYTKIY